MPHIKFQGNRSSGSGGRLLKGFYHNYMVMAAILAMWPGPFEQTFVATVHGNLTWKLTSISSVISENMFENVDRQTMTMAPSHTISSPVSQRPRWAKNKRICIICTKQSIHSPRSFIISGPLVFKVLSRIQTLLMYMPVIHKSYHRNTISCLMNKIKNHAWSPPNILSIYQVSWL